MIRLIRGQFEKSSAAFRDVLANPALRWLQLAWVGSTLGGTSYVVALLVYAFESDGAYAVGLIGLIRWLAGGLVAPVGGIIADRFPRVRTIVVCGVVRAGLMVAMGIVVLIDAPSLIVYAMAVALVVLTTPVGPAEAALLPSLARTPQELTAANVAGSTVESLGWFIGPAMGGIVLALTSVSATFIIMSLFFVFSALMVARIPEQPLTRSAPDETGELRETLEGFRVLAKDKNLRLLAGLFAAQTLVDGALAVLVVVLALDTLDLGNAGVGYLNSASGVGGLIGVVMLGALIARARLAADFRLGLFAWGVPVVVLGLVPEPALVLLALVLVGAANTILDVSGDTLLQRAVPEEVLGRVWGVLESMTLVAVAIGSAVAPLVAAAFGIRTALVATGALLPLLGVLTWRRLLAIDAAAIVPERELGLLRELPMFAPLGPPTLEYLAGRLRPLHVPAGQTIFHEGDPGDQFYVIADGRVQVVVDGRPARELGAGDYFGEIALLRAVPRTATVAAEDDVELYALDGDEFVAAVTGHAESVAAAESVVATRLGLRSSA